MRTAAAALLAAVLAASPAAAERPPLFKQVDHFFARSADAERLFLFFRDDLGLPEAWPYRDWGGFASGAVTLGNTAFEVVEKKADTTASFAKIAFEPVGDAAAAIAELDARGVAHGPEEPHPFTSEGKTVVGWSTVDLPALPPAGAAFICDYKMRARVAEGRQKASDALAASGGGPLGVSSIREIVLAVRDLKAAEAAWTAIAGPSVEDRLFSFGPGPKVRLVRGKTEGIERIVLGIRAADRARAFLASRRILGSARGDRVTIAPSAIGGLRVELVEE